MKFFVLSILLPGLGMAAILPEAIGPYHRTSVTPTTLSDKPLWNEYGLKEAETAAYENGKEKLTVTAWRLVDSTAALAAFDWQRPAGARPSKAAPTAAETGDSLLLAIGNYLLLFKGYKPNPAELSALSEGLVNVDTTSLPVLATYLPDANLVSNSERYVTGPVGLGKFVPGIPPSVAAFHFGTEAQTGVFHSPKGDMTLAIFNYPTPQIAMQRVPEFEKLSGAVVKRSGPFVAVVLRPPDPDFAEHLLGSVRWQAAITRDEYVPTRRDNIGDLILNIFILIGILLAFSLVSGLALGGVRAFLRRGKTGVDAEPMILLHLEER